MGCLSEVSCTICYHRHHQHQQHQKKLMIRFNLIKSACWTCIHSFFQKISWGWHPGAATGRGLIVVMNCILWFVSCYILLSVFGWCIECRNMQGTGTHNSCFMQFSRFLYSIWPCTDHTVTILIIYPRSLLWRSWHWHCTVDSTHIHFTGVNILQNLYVTVHFLNM